VEHLNVMISCVEIRAQWIIINLLFEGIWSTQKVKRSNLHNMLEEHYLQIMHLDLY
jgi:hypothetical protein